jgi:putative RecB family exonuclease
MTAQTLQLIHSMKSRLHISYSQLNTYLSCPLKYRFQYVEQHKPERIGSGLVFGKAIHEAAATFHRSIMEDGEPLPESVATQIFEEHLLRELKESPIHFKKGEKPESLVKKGAELVSILYKRERTNKVILVEQPFEAPLVNDKTGEVSDVSLFGVMDLVEEDQEGNRVIVDLKTSGTRYDDFRMQSDQQLTFYSELGAANGLLTDENALLRFDVLLKQKVPSMESYYTVRGLKDRLRLKKTIFQVLEAIAAGIFYPTPSFMCGDCGYSSHCGRW